MVTTTTLNGRNLVCASLCVCCEELQEVNISRLDRQKPAHRSAIRQPDSPCRESALHRSPAPRGMINRRFMTQYDSTRSGWVTPAPRFVAPGFIPARYRSADPEVDAKASDSQHTC